MEAGWKLWCPTDISCQQPRRDGGLTPQAEITSRPKPPLPARGQHDHRPRSPQGAHVCSMPWFPRHWVRGNVYFMPCPLQLTCPAPSQPHCSDSPSPRQHHGEQRSPITPDTHPSARGDLTTEPSLLPKIPLQTMTPP